MDGVAASELLACGIFIEFCTRARFRLAKCVTLLETVAFAQSAAVVTILATAVIAGMHDAGMACVGKHFPGHGGVSLDSHVELPIDERSYQQLSLNDLQPYQSLIHQLDAVMPSHIVYSDIDASPAGFFIRVVTRYFTH